MIRFTVDGPPVGKERPRKGRGRRFYTPDKTRRYEQRVAAAFLQVARRRLSPPALSVRLWCYFKNGRHPDGDNCLKLVLDAMTGLAYPNDKNVASSVIPCFDAKRPRIEVEVE